MVQKFCGNAPVEVGSLTPLFSMVLYIPGGQQYVTNDLDGKSSLQN